MLLPFLEKAVGLAAGIIVVIDTLIIGRAGDLERAGGQVGCIATEVVDARIGLGLIEKNGRGILREV